MYVIQYKLDTKVPYYVEKLEEDEESGNLIPVLTWKKENARKFGAIDGSIVMYAMIKNLGCECELVD